MAPPRRLGIFGGAFDPPHRAHHALARAAIAQLQLDELRLLPTGQAWHKPQALSEARHRLAMCRLAFADLPEVFVDDRETRREGDSYTIDTLESLQAECPGAQWFLIIGGDQWRAFGSWRRGPDILQRATLVVADRADPVPAGAQGPGDLPPALALEWPHMAVSATDIRRRVRHHQPIDALVLPAVAGYISDHQLYSRPE